jgi:hypothetical protein
MQVVLRVFVGSMLRLPLLTSDTLSPTFLGPIYLIMSVGIGIRANPIRSLVSILRLLRFIICPVTIRLAHGLFCPYRCPVTYLPNKLVQTCESYRGISSVLYLGLFLGLRGMNGEKSGVLGPTTGNPRHFNAEMKGESFLR